MYDRTSQCQRVNDTRKVLLAQKERTLENINIPLLLMHYYSTTREWHTKLNVVGGSAWFLILRCFLLVNGEGQNPSQMHDSLSGPPYLKHQKYARSL